MLSETEREKIRRGFYLDHKSIRQLAKEEKRDRRTIRRALSSSVPPSPPSVRSQPAPVFGPYRSRVEALLRQNEQLPPKQRYTSYRIFETIREEGYPGGESTVRHAITAL